MELLYAIPLGLSLSFAAGPIFFVLIETSIRQGKARAWALDLGAVAADLVFIALIWYGSHSFLVGLRQNIWLGLLSGMAVAFFGLYYLLKSKKPGQLQQDLPLTRKRYTFIKGFLLNFLNVGVLFFWLAITVAFGSMLDHEPMRMRLFYGATLGSYLFFDAFKIYFAHRFKRHFGGRRLQMIEKLMGLILMLFGLFIALRQIWQVYGGDS